MKGKLMAHLVASYPNYDSSLAIVEALVRGGATMIEIQFPFSDPTADGPVIQDACRRALDGGFRVDDGFRLVKEAALLAPVFIMSYGNIVFSRGIEDFVAASKDAGALGLIIADLTPGYDGGLYRAGRSAGMEIIPVVVPTVTDKRLEEITSIHPAYIYAAMRVGITGKRTDFGKESIAFLGRLATTGARILAGFGISSGEQVALLGDAAYSPVVGSAFVREIAKGGDYLERITALTAGLVSG
ncbi:MAG: tryptophan synthase subunit alpha [Spirochaetales bacterium]|nr:tryptophan synthase subunit alpha [Spirochaetales bacterium]